jgi:cell division inhibitor SulA/protein ImuA
VAPSRRKELLRNLVEQIRSLEQADCKTQWASAVSSGFASLDRLLPKRGFVGGTLVEWLGEGPGTGAMTLALAVGGRLARTEGVVVVVDARREFFPPAAAALGVPLERTVVVEPADARMEWWALEQALMSGAVSVTLGRIERANERVLRRLLLATEKGGGLGFLMRPASLARSGFCAGMRLLVTTLPNTDGSGWRLQVELLACRGCPAGSKAIVELTDETNHVPVVAELAGTATGRRATRAS